MRRKPSVRRMITGLLAACLIPLGLLPATAHAAEEAAPGPNLALGRPATASGVNGSYGAGNVTDGNQGSYWEGPDNSFPQWVRIDLGTKTSVNQVTLKLPTPGKPATRR